MTALKEKPIWTITRIAEHLGVHRSTIFRWIQLGTRVGSAIRRNECGTWYAFPSELEEAMKC